MKQVGQTNSDCEHLRKRKRKRKRIKEKKKIQERKRKISEKGRCQNDKNGPLKNVYFCLENTVEAPSNVWFSWEQSAERPCEPQGGSPFSLGEGQTIAECGLFTRENGEPTCEGPDSEEERKLFLGL